MRELLPFSLSGLRGLRGHRWDSFAPPVVLYLTTFRPSSKPMPHKCHSSSCLQTVQRVCTTEVRLRQSSRSPSSGPMFGGQPPGKRPRPRKGPEDDFVLIFTVPGIENSQTAAEWRSRHRLRPHKMQGFFTQGSARRGQKMILY